VIPTLSKALIAVKSPVRVTVWAPLLATVTLGATAWFTWMVPRPADRVTVICPLPVPGGSMVVSLMSTSLMEIPVKTFGWSSIAFWGPIGMEMTGASLTGRTVIVKVSVVICGPLGGTGVAGLLPSSLAVMLNSTCPLALRAPRYFNPSGCASIVLMSVSLPRTVTLLPGLPVTAKAGTIAVLTVREPDCVLGASGVTDKVTVMTPSAPPSVTSGSVITTAGIRKSVSSLTSRFPGSEICGGSFTARTVIVTRPTPDAGGPPVLPKSLARIVNTSWPLVFSVPR